MLSPLFLLLALVSFLNSSQAFAPRGFLSSTRNAALPKLFTNGSGTMAPPRPPRVRRDPASPPFAPLPHSAAVPAPKDEVEDERRRRRRFKLTPEEIRTGLEGYRRSAKKSCRTKKDYNEHMAMIQRMADWADMVEKHPNRIRRPLSFGNFVSGKLRCMAALELVYRGYPHSDRCLYITQLAWHPSYVKSESGFAMMEALKAVGQESAMVLDCSQLRKDPATLIFTLANMPTLDSEPVKEDPKVTHFKKCIKNFHFVLDGNLGDGVDLGHFWYSSKTKEETKFFFRRPIGHVANEFEVTFERPNSNRSIRLIEPNQVTPDIPPETRMKINEIGAELARRLGEAARAGKASS